jgi:hypothetical protein
MNTASISKIVLKICIDPHCSEIAHNCPKSETKCRTCSMKLVEISRSTFEKKFLNFPFHFDYRTGEAVSKI